LLGALAAQFLGGALSESLRIRRRTRELAAQHTPTVGGTTTPARLKEAKIQFGVYAGQLLQISLGAAYQALQELKSTGLMANASRNTIPNDIYQRLTESAEVNARARKYNLIK